MANSTDSEKTRMEMSSSTYLTSQQPIASNLVHYRNIFANPENFIRRKVDYSKMKVYDEKYRKESERLKSLGNLTTVNRDLLPLIAKTGFYYKENPSAPDQVRCIYCQGNLANWKKNDKPTKRHKYSYPTCPYIIYLNVGNEPLGYDSCKSPNEDPDVCKPKTIISFIIYNPKVDVGGDMLDQLNHLDVENREKTFVNFPNLKYLALRGFYIANKDGNASVICSWCFKETPVLIGIENLDYDWMHRKNCHYRNMEDKLEDIDISSETSEDFCDVEYSVVPQEIEARMEMRSTTQLLNSGIDRETLRSLLEHRLKCNGKDFESLFELIHELKKDLRYKKKRSLKEPNAVLADFQCVVCLDQPVEVVFLPCGHLKTCNSCSDLMLSCPVCRILIIKRVKRFRFNSL